MSCERYEQTLLLHACGDEPAGPDLLDHVRDCEACAREIEEIRGVRETYRSEPAAKPARVRTHRWIPALAVAAALLFAVTGFVLLSPPAPPATPGAAAPVMSGPDLDAEIASVRAELDRLDFSDDSF